ncbi:unnamed protein product [Psylliodes chrysocephalus]|uniref:Uncharacterized protein n=1 Tax=Psylliodes chrysocephalus TaxID=3402493 RepID=A0A9P0D8B5_9CUCU|nr:unnamed protein product [Psylliodes chrysocephala]
MVFQLEGKVALITGGASGLGLSHAKELLRNGLKGVALADIDETAAESALQQINNEFGPGKASFVKTDVTSNESFEAAFKKTIDYFKHVDILINNAGMVNDKLWEKEVDINLKGTIQGIFLGMEIYLRNYKSGEEAVILNTSSIAGLRGNPAIPVYSATKYAIMGMTGSFGAPYHYERTKVRIITVCPGLTVQTDVFNRGEYTFSPEYMGAWVSPLEELYANKDYIQTPEHLSKEVVRMIKFAENGSVYVVEQGLPSFKYCMALKETMRNKLLIET